MPWITAATLFLISILSACSYAFADHPDCVERTIPVSLSDRNGVPLPNLTASNLQGTYQKRPIVIRSVEVNDRPPRVMVLVDTSGSMRTTGSSNADLAAAVVSKLPANVEVGLAFFAAKTVLVVTPTTDRVKLLYALEPLRKGFYYDEGMTALRSALLDSVKIFGPPVFGDTVLLISDGGENHSKASERDVEGILVSSGIRVFALTLQSEFGLLIRSRTVEELDGPGTVQAVVRSTGGTALLIPPPYFPTRPADILEKNGKETQLGHDIGRQIEQLLKFYRVEITLPGPVDKPRNWKLDLAGFDKGPAGKLELIYPTVLTPCR